MFWYCILSTRPIEVLVKSPRRNKRRNKLPKMKGSSLIKTWKTLRSLFPLPVRPSKHERVSGIKQTRLSPVKFCTSQARLKQLESRRGRGGGNKFLGFLLDNINYERVAAGHRWRTTGWLAIGFGFVRSYTKHEPLTRGSFGKNKGMTETFFFCVCAKLDACEVKAKEVGGTERSCHEAFSGHGWRRRQGAWVRKIMYP